MIGGDEVRVRCWEAKVVVRVTGDGGGVVVLALALFVCLVSVHLLSDESSRGLNLKEWILFDNQTEEKAKMNDRKEVKGSEGILKRFWMTFVDVARQSKASKGMIMTTYKCLKYQCFSLELTISTRLAMSTTNGYLG